MSVIAPTRAERSENRVVDGRDQDACAAGLAPDTIIDGVGLGTVVIAGIERAVVDHQLAVKQMQLLESGMPVARIFGTERESHQHADAILLRVRRKQLDG